MKSDVLLRIFPALLVLLPSILRAQTEPIIAAVMEGSGDNKAVEIYNPTSSSIDLSDYSIQLAFNGASNFTTGFNLSGNLAAGASYIIANPSCGACTSPDATNNLIAFNGNDAIGLQNNTTGTLVDAFGMLDNGGTDFNKDRTYRRQIGACTPDDNPNDAWDFSNWDNFAQDTYPGDINPAFTCTVCPGTPSNPATNAVISQITSSSATIEWDGSDASNYLVLMRSGGQAPFTPSDNTTYTADANFGSGQSVGPGYFVVYNGSNTSVDVTGLTNLTTYSVRVFAFNCPGGQEKYLTTNPPENNFVAQDQPLFSLEAGTFSAEESAGSYTFRVEQAVATACQVRLVDATNLEGTAPPADYDFPADTLLSFNGTETQKTFTLPLNDNSNQDGSRTVRLKLRNATGACMLSGDSALTLTITDDETDGTVLGPGEIAFVAFDSQVLGSGAEDGLAFTNLEPLDSGTKIIFTDKGYESGAAPGVKTNEFRSGEGWFEIRYDGNTPLPAGSITTFRNLGFGSAADLDLPANWSFSDGSSGINYANSGDELFILQGEFTSATQFEGTFLYGYSSVPWVPLSGTPSGSSGGGTSRLPRQLTCLSFEGDGSSTVRNSYDGIRNGTRAAIFDKLKEPGEWAGNTYTPGSDFSITAPGGVVGRWTGSEDNNWFNSCNWELFRVPDKNIDVVIPASAARDPIIDVESTTAEARSITVEGRTLTLSGNSNVDLAIGGNLQITGSGAVEVSGQGQIALGGNLLNDLGASAFRPGSGTLVLEGGKKQRFRSADSLNFHNLTLDKTGDSLVLEAPINIGGALSLSQGMVKNPEHPLRFEASASEPTGGSASSHIMGVALLRRNATGAFELPIGKGGRYAPVTVSPQSSTGSEYSAEFFPSNPNDSGFSTANLQAPLCSVHQSEFWQISQQGSNATFKLPWSPATGLADTSGLTTATFNLGGSNNWQATGQRSTKTGNANAGAITTATIPALPSSPTPIGFGFTNTLEAPQLSDTSVCAGADLVIRSGNGQAGEFRWYPGDDTLNPLAGQTGDTLLLTNITEDTLLWADRGTTNCRSPKDSILISVGQLSVAIDTGSGPTNLCAGENIQLSVSSSQGGVGYRWERLQPNDTLDLGSGQAIIASDTGRYVLFGDDGSCVGSDTVRIGRQAPINAQIALPTQDTSLCSGDSLQLVASPNNPSTFSYQWQRNGSPVSGANTPTFKAGDTGGYSVVLTRNGCSATSATLRFEWFPAIDNNLNASGTQTLCPGEAFTLEAAQNAAYSYQWLEKGAGGVFNPLSDSTDFNIVIGRGGTFRAEISANGCTVLSDTLRLEKNSPFNAQIAEPATELSVCPRGFTDTLVAAPTGPAFSYQWLNRGQPIVGATDDSLPITDSGRYRVIVTQNGCFDTSQALRVAFEPFLAASVGATGGSSACDTITLTAPAGNASYQWLRNGAAMTDSTSRIIRVAQAGDYRVVVQADGGNCPDTSDAFTVAPATPFPAPTVEDSVLCGPGSAVFHIEDGPAPNTPYFWYASDTSATPLEIRNDSLFSTPQLDSTEDFWVQRGQGQCASPRVRVRAIVQDIPFLVTRVSRDTVELEDTVRLQAIVRWVSDSSLVTNAQYQWSPSAEVDTATKADPIATPGEVGLNQYTVTVTIPGGCGDPLEGTVEVFVEEAPLEEIFIPNAFSPRNGDGHNDAWIIENIDQERLGQVSIQVYSRWGNEVFSFSGSGSDYLEQPFTGSGLPTGTYYYVVDIENHDAESGTLSIID